MGIYLNPGSKQFERALRGEIYVDKTSMIHYLNSVVSTPQSYLSVSRPRRFGKTMACDMICAYYGRTLDSRSLFENRKLAEKKDWDRYLNSFDVIRLVMTDFLGDTENVKKMLSCLEEEVLDELIGEYPDIKVGTRRSLRTFMTRVYNHTGRLFVIVIDEWDAVFRKYLDDEEGQTLYLDFLRDWLKDKDYVALSYMTGILPIKKYGQHSALNMFREYSMTSPGKLARYAGFTEEEVKEICIGKDLNFDGFKNWYDGYRLSEQKAEVKTEDKAELGEQTGQVYEIYSPLSVVYAAIDRSLGNYWNQTETFEALRKYINRNYDGLREVVTVLMDGGRMPVDITTYQNDMTTFHSKDDILTLLIHLGYLGYDSETKEAFVPNKEVLDVFRSSTKTQEWTASFRALEESHQLLLATWACDEETVARLLEAAHEQAGTDGYHSEAAFSYAIQLAYYNARNYYTKVQELPAGKGYADLVYLPSPEHPDKPALLIELKYNKNVEAAISQIHRQNYPKVLEKYKGHILLVGLSYNREEPSDNVGFKHHSCLIEKA